MKKLKNILQNQGVKITLSAIIILLASYGLTHAGSLTPSASPAASMYTFSDIYNKIQDFSYDADEGDHDLSTSTSPASTFHSLTDIWDALAGQTDLTAGNIKTGATILGVDGTYTAGGGTGLPQTGQTHCNAYSTDGNYTPSQVPCSGTNQDGDLQRGVARSYTDNGDGTISDNATGLMWQKCSAGQSGSDCSGDSATPLTFDNSDGTHEAINYCENLSLGGHTDWHLPSVNELFSILDFGEDDPAINPTYFPNTQSNSYWTSTAYEGFANDVFPIDFRQGTIRVDFTGMYNSYLVRCVR